MQTLTLVDAIQTAYGRIWHNAHAGHAGRSSGLSERDQRLLSHLGAPARDTAELAQHLGIAPSTLSEHLGDLEARGLVARARDPADRRRVHVALTPDGRRARTADGPLDPERLAAALDRLGAERATRVAAALDDLATALVSP